MADRDLSTASRSTWTSRSVASTDLGEEEGLMEERAEKRGTGLEGLVS